MTRQAQTYPRRRIAIAIVLSFAATAACVLLPSFEKMILVLVASATFISMTLKSRKVDEKSVLQSAALSAMLAGGVHVASVAARLVMTSSDLLPIPIESAIALGLIAIGFVITTVLRLG